jgi:nucleotide-binding universal stress UspA family protein
MSDVGSHAGVAIDVVVERAEPAELIRHTAQRYGSELIVTGMARDETLGRVLLGTTVDALAYRAPAPVLIVKARPRAPYQRALVATDFSESSRNALEAALALLPAAPITLFHAFGVGNETDIGDNMTARDAIRQQALDECRAFIAATPAAAMEQARITPLCEYGDLRPLLQDRIDVQDFPLVVLGTSGHSGIAGFLLGNTGLVLATAVPVDVLLVRRQISQG